jgi:crotonobetainyl-CoA:carnitine CoA-transferase CaiB-like acyl-CoA transferase
VGTALEVEPDELLTTAVPMPRINDAVQPQVLAVAARLGPVQAHLATLRAAGITARSIDVTDSALRGMRCLLPADADGWVVLAPVSGQQIKRALVAAGLEAAMAELKAQPDAVAASQRFFELFGDHLRSRTTAEWLAVFADADVPASAVMGKAEHLADEQVAHQAMYRIADEPGVGPVRRVRHPALFDGAPVDTDDLPSPPLGD